MKDFHVTEEDASPPKRKSSTSNHENLQFWGNFSFPGSGLESRNQRPTFIRNQSGFWVRNAVTKFYTMAKI